MERNYIVSIDTIDKVKEFVNVVSSYDAFFDLISGRYVIDGKSIMGIFSLDLSKDISLKVSLNDGEPVETFDAIEKALAIFIVKESK